MKKIISLLIVFAALLSFASCTSGNIVIVDPTKKPEKTEITSEATSDTTPTPSETAGITSMPSLTPGVTPTPSITPGTTPTPSLTPGATPTPTPIPTPTPSVTDKPDTPEPLPEHYLKETADGGLEYQNKITFFGDSTTWGMVPYKALPDGKDTKQVWWGANGNTVALFNIKTVKIASNAFGGETYTFAQAVEKFKPEILVVTLGINSGNIDDNAFKVFYKYIIDTVFEKSPDTKLICQSIYPVRDYYENDDGEMVKVHKSNAEIIKHNKLISELVAEKNTKGFAVYYLDTYSKLIDEKGFLKKEYENGGDGIHLKEAGFKAVLDNIRTHMVPAESSP